MVSNTEGPLLSLISQNMSSNRSGQVQSLIQQCQTYIAMHLEEFPVSHLSLLPLFTRKDLLWQLPLADVCWLEDTNFTVGLDMAAYWKFLLGDQCTSIIDPAEDSDVERYIQQKWGSDTQLDYAKAILYGQLITHAIGCRDGDFTFHIPHKGRCVDHFKFLFAVRNICEFRESSYCYLEIPPRHSHKLDLSDEERIQEVVNCFKGELPTVLAEIYMYEDIEVSYTHFLREVVCMGVHGMWFEAEFMNALVQEANHLEVLILEGYYGDDDEPVSLDEFCSCLSAQPTFWSRFQLLKVLSATFPGSGYVVSQEIFNKLISAYFCASTNHTQKVQFTETTITSDLFNNTGPTVDQCYLPFKTIELNHCRFEHYATRKTISGWLGHHISELESEFGSCFFKVNDKIASGVTRKRKFSELDNDLT